MKQFDYIRTKHEHYIRQSIIFSDFLFHYPQCFLFRIFLKVGLKKNRFS